MIFEYEVKGGRHFGDYLHFSLAHHSQINTIDFFVLIVFFILFFSLIQLVLCVLCAVRFAVHLDLHKKKKIHRKNANLYKTLQYNVSWVIRKLRLLNETHSNWKEKKISVEKLSWVCMHVRCVRACECTSSSSQTLLCWSRIYIPIYHIYLPVGSAAAACSSVQYM